MHLDGATAISIFATRPATSFGPTVEGGPRPPGGYPEHAEEDGDVCVGGLIVDSFLFNMMIIGIYRKSEPIEKKHEV
jgi:hypothetical protein